MTPEERAPGEPGPEPCLELREQAREIVLTREIGEDVPDECRDGWPGLSCRGFALGEVAGKVLDEVLDKVLSKVLDEDEGN